ncbi:hypothetical protein M378DRAFT_864530 [Amanita muscaria Koide BX008]|uniref:Uncharacterized protein n=1 Tax=Amanita muscaria (strain Koide BX008) TaxID=946122 RepID=A0A0C2T3Y6_AMAMK|nr:hypothetical protein M378DRAFT_864530 [Amanita muscaria Koide BX008]
MSNVLKGKSKADPGQKSGIEPPAIRVEEPVCIHPRVPIQCNYPYPPATPTKLASWRFVSTQSKGNVAKSLLRELFP